MTTPSFSPAGVLRLALLLAAATCVQFAEGNSNVISDQRIRYLDIAPALGRGYSVSTNQFHSICLSVEETTEPSYNYDYQYSDISSALEDSSSVELSAAVKASFGWVKVRAEMEAQRDSSVRSSSHTVVTTMRIERYYSSVKEDASSLSDDAKTLLDEKDYVGFFKACGPSYVRSIRRAQEVTAIFTFTSNDSSVVANMKGNIEAIVYGQKFSASASSSKRVEKSMSTLKIKIVGFGLGLDKDGSETLVATSLEEYNAVMSFAYNSMTRGNQGSAQTGMVYGIEVVPWVNNPSFQVAIKLSEFPSDITWTVGHELIPDAVVEKKCTDGHKFDAFEKCCEKSKMDEVDEDKKKCREDSIVEHAVTKKCTQGGLSADFFNKCCDESDKESIDEETKRCAPKRPFDPSVLKNNLQANAEHVTEMDSVLRHKMLTILTLERCVSMLRALPESQDNTYLETPDSVLAGDRGKPLWDTQLTVQELRSMLDPDEKMSSSALLNMELDEWVDMYYNRCMYAMFGMNRVTTAQSNYYFMTVPWSQHPECAPRTCLIPTNRWNGDTGIGCIPSFARKMNIGNQTTPSNSSCAKKWNGSTHECLRTSDDWKNKIDAVHGCWSGDTPPLTVIEQYCTPRLSYIKKSGEIKDCTNNMTPTSAFTRDS